MSSSQLHKRLSNQQVATILEHYCSKEIPLEHALLNLGIQQARFFRILEQYRNHPDTFTIGHARTYANNKLGENIDSSMVAVHGREIVSDHKLGRLLADDPVRGFLCSRNGVYIYLRLRIGVFKVWIPSEVLSGSTLDIQICS